MTKNDFLGVCAECEVNPNLVIEVPEVVELLLRDKNINKIENQLLLHTLIHKYF